MNAEDKEPLVVLFLDALDQTEVSGFLEETKAGNIDVSELPQMVTPSVLGRYLTGKDEADTGMIRVTKPFENPVNHPSADTFLTDLHQKVFIYNVPMTLGLELKNGVNAGSGAGGQFNDVMNVPQGAYSMWQDDPDRIINQMADTTAALFSTLRTSIRNGEFDIYFISYRLVDTLTHFLYEEGLRENLINFLETQVFLTGEISNLVWFSDHGGMKKKDTFWINRWLEENGYLSTTILYEVLDQVNEKNDNGITQQVGPHNNICQIDKGSQAVSYDAYDAAVDILDEDAPVEEIIDGLMDTGYFEWVKHKSELYDENGSAYDKLPAIIPKRKAGVLVTGNCHKDAGPDAACQGAIRDGVHSPRACWGMNFNTDHYVTREDPIKPVQFHQLLKYLFMSAPEVRKGADEDEELSQEEQDKIYKRLEGLGYV